MSESSVAVARRFQGPALVLPALALLLVVFVTSLMLVFAFSFGGSDLTLSHYQSFLTSPAYLSVLGRTFGIGALVTLACLALAYPYAYAMVKAAPNVRFVLAGLVLLSFWTSILVRTFAWQLWLSDTGIINSLLLDTGILDEPLPLIRNLTGVTIGMVHVLLPFMIFPLYAVMRRIDRSLVRSALTLGASPRRAFFHVFLPLSVPGIVAGGTFVFILALGFYITPAVLGSPQQALLSQVIVQQAQSLLNWGLAGAMATVVFVVTLLLLAVVNRFVSVRAAISSSQR